MFVLVPRLYLGNGQWDWAYGVEFDHAVGMFCFFSYSFPFHFQTGFGISPHRYSPFLLLASFGYSRSRPYTFIPILFPPQIARGLDHTTYARRQTSWTRPNPALHLLPNTLPDVLFSPLVRHAHQPLRPSSSHFESTNRPARNLRV